MDAGNLKLSPNGKVFLNKTMGCYREFGIKEVMRRIFREIISSAADSENRLDLSYVTEKLAIGSAPNSIEAVRNLEKLGFGQVIDLRAERRVSDILVASKDILVTWVPTHDDWKAKPPDFFQNLEIEIKKWVFSRNGGKLFICCKAGEHRAPLAGVLALVFMGYSFDTSLSMIQKARPVAELLPVYLESLRRFLESSPAGSQERKLSPQISLKEAL